MEQPFCTFLSYTFNTLSTLDTLCTLYTSLTQGTRTSSPSQEERKWNRFPLGNQTARTPRTHQRNETKRFPVWTHPPPPIDIKLNSVYEIYTWRLATKPWCPWSRTKHSTKQCKALNNAISKGSLEEKLRNKKTWMATKSSMIITQFAVMTIRLAPLTLFEYQKTCLSNDVGRPMAAEHVRAEISSAMFEKQCQCWAYGCCRIETSMMEQCLRTLTDFQAPQAMSSSAMCAQIALGRCFRLPSTDFAIFTSDPTTECTL